MNPKPRYWWHVSGTANVFSDHERATVEAIWEEWLLFRVEKISYGIFGLLPTDKFDKLQDLLASSLGCVEVMVFISKLDHLLVGKTIHLSSHIEITTIGHG